VTVFPANRVEAVPVERAGVRLATVYGTSYAERAVTDNLARRFRRVPNAGLHVGLLHCTVGGDLEHAPYAPCRLQDLIDAGMDYWALGHLHRHRVVREGDPWIVYPGSLQGRSPKPSERGPKGACVVSVEEDAVKSVEHVNLSRARFVAMELDIGGIRDLPALKAAALEHLERLRREDDGSGLIVRATLAGRGELSSDVKRPGSLDALLGEFREESEALHPFVWWERLCDRTGAPVDLDAVRRRSDFSAAAAMSGAISIVSPPVPAKAARVLSSDPRRMLGQVATSDIGKNIRSGFCLRSV
jgi:predicted phosphodiesterase